LNHPGEHDDPILLTRGGDPRAILAAIALPIATVAAGITSFNHINAILTPTAPVQSTDTILAWICCTVTALGAVLTAYYARVALTKAVFRTQSAELVMLGRVRRRMPYADCERFTYRRHRTYCRGVWIGTYFSVRLAAKGRKAITLSGLHGEWPTLFGVTSLKKEFRGNDEIDLLPSHVGGIIADAWEERLAAGEQIRWLEGFTLTDRGVIPRSGPLKGECVRYHRVTLHAESVEIYGLVIEGERPMARDIATGSPNFWPGAIVIERRGGTADECEPTIAGSGRQQ